MAQPVYTYMVHDLMSHVPLGELPLSGVRYSKRLNDSGSMAGSFRVQSRELSTRMVRDPYDLTMPCRRSLYIYRDERPMWGGIIWTRRYDSSTGVVQLGAADWWSYFDHRKLLPVLPADPAVDHVAQLVTSYSRVEQNEIARQLVALAQSHTGGDIGVELDATASGILRDRTYDGHQLVDVGEALRNLAGVIQGPDMMFDVAATLDDTGRPRRVLRLGEPWLGQQSSPWVFDYGGNLVAYTWPSDGSRYASRAFAVSDGAASGVDIAVAEDSSRYERGYPLAELETSYSGISSAATLRDHADADQQVARLPVVLPTLTVRGDRSPVVGEWGVGDDAVVTIEDDFQPRGITTTMRIVQADIAPGESAEAVTLTMAPLLDDVA